MSLVTLYGCTPTTFWKYGVGSDPDRRKDPWPSKSACGIKNLRRGKPAQINLTTKGPSRTYGVECGARTSFWQTIHVEPVIANGEHLIDAQYAQALANVAVELGARVIGDEHDLADVEVGHYSEALAGLAPGADGDDQSF